jgi:hypothetical protein
MKEAEVAATVKQLLQADKVIHEQQLGWPWLPPDDALFSPAAQQPSSPAARAGSVAHSSTRTSRFVLCCVCLCLCLCVCACVCR